MKKKLPNDVASWTGEYGFPFGGSQKSEQGWV